MILQMHAAQGNRKNCVKLNGEFPRIVETHWAQENKRQTFDSPPYENRERFGDRSRFSLVYENR